VNFWKLILATIVIYGAGVFTGGLLIDHVDHRPKPRPTHPEPVAAANPNTLTNAPGQPGSKLVRLPDIMNRQFLQQLDARLHLTQDQREAIQKIIADRQNFIHTTVQDARLEIREQLTPEQRDQFDDLVKSPPHRRPSTNAPPLSLEQQMQKFETNPQIQKVESDPQVQKIMAEAERLQAMTNTPQVIPPRLPQTDLHN